MYRASRWVSILQRPCCLVASVSFLPLERMPPEASPILVGGRAELARTGVRSTKSSPTMRWLSQVYALEKETSTNNDTHSSPHASRLTDLFLKQGPCSTTRIFP
ncbi:hypothetical protein M440DRAFT_1026776 [Trichoderma longibrachiatum ATCC 18648]|uniref:Uncharacterized protein n=1 Tax=Trichoderma longibrachiatum ATCC 18648 TaxID=983965 RepID=A0A2T4CK24_TRILO|nr:hypothetical protein M440DRAFT_1026776 [Trichoderma longibrachiatum ATCC 18648]